MTGTGKRERVMAAVQGGPADRVPVSFWYHFPLDHPSGEPLAEAELDFARKYDPDFLKVMHDLVLDLPEELRHIEDPADWEKLKPLDPEAGNFLEQLKALKILRKELGQDMILIDTLFDPYAAANKLCSKRLMEHYRANPKAVKHGLHTIAVSLANYAEAWIRNGGDGIFYALNSAQQSIVSEEEYREIFMPLDRLVLEKAMKHGTFNVLHIHGNEIYFETAQSLPCHAVNWSSQTTYPSIYEGRSNHDGCIAGGIDETTIASKLPEEVIDEGRISINDAGETCFILTPGCAIPTDTPEELIFALRQAVE